MNAPRASTAAAATSPDHADDRLLSRELLLILVTTALFGLSFSSYFLFPKYLATEMSASPATIGGLSAVSMFVSVLLMPWVGVAVDRRGRRPFSTLGAAVFALASAGFLFVDSVGPLMWVLRAMHGAAFTLFFISLSTLTTDLAPPQRLGQAIGFFGGVMISTNALGPALAEWGAHEFGWTAVFGATAVSATLALVLTRLVREPPRTPHPHDASTRMIDLLRRPGLRRVLVVATLAGCAMGTLFTFYQPWALQRGLARMADFLIAFAGCAMVVRFGLGGMADRFGRQRVATVALFFYVAAPLALIGVDTVGLAVAGALLGLSHGLFFPALNAVAFEYAGQHERGTAMASYHGAFNIGFSAGSYLLGFLVATLGYPGIFAIVAGCCVLAFVLLVTARRAPTGGGA